MDNANMLEAFRETTRHVRLTCRYAAAVVDAVARAVAMAVGWDAQRRGRRRAEELLREVSAAMVTGHRTDGKREEGPMGVVVAELSRVLIERRQRNACGHKLECSTTTAYEAVIKAVTAVMRHSWREASERERDIELWVKPKGGDEAEWEDSPTKRWIKEWEQFTQMTGAGPTLRLPATLAEVTGATAATTVESIKVLASPVAEGNRVRLHLSVAAVLAPIVIGPLTTPPSVLTPSAAANADRQRGRTAPPPSPPRDLWREGILTVYVDGSGKNGGGWGIVAVEGGTGHADATATLRSEHYGPLALDPDAAPFCGAERSTSATAELSAFAEGLEYLREIDGTTNPAVIRPDSEYARDIALGRKQPHVNKALATHVRALWKAEETRRGGQLWAVHVKGHAGNKWNGMADAGAARGTRGRVRGFGTRWRAWPPLSPRVRRAHACDEATRVLRAKHTFGILGSFVPANDRMLSHAHLRGLLGEVERRLEDAPRDARTRRAHEKAKDAYHRLRNPALQLRMRRRLQQALKPVTNEIECEVNVEALEQYAANAGGEADVVVGTSAKRAGWMAGLTMREITREYLRRIGPNAKTTMPYTHSLLGAELIAAGYVVDSREYTIRDSGLDPFRLPRVLRDAAFAGLGHDFDDVAAYPRAALDVFHSGRNMSRLFMAHRESIMQQTGRYFFGEGVPAGERRDRMKQLFNSLDNDGGISAWRRKFGVAADRQARNLRIDVGAGRTFSLPEYERSREELTTEFEERMPGMTRFVQRWQAAHHVRGKTPALTAKNYLLQEAEAISRSAKIEYARVRGDLPVYNLQHDGVIMGSAGRTTEEVRAGLQEASSRALGYAQPVEIKSRPGP
jgi:ribonuclease HI